MRIVEATTTDQLTQAADLMREFLAWTRIRFDAMPEIVTAYYDMDAWERELDDLGREYYRPDGGLLLALDNEAAIGCVALRRFDADICEMKRLFVTSDAQRRGAGRALCLALFDLGRELGFSRMRLETGDLQAEAHALYRSLGFRDIAPYRTHPGFLLDHMICMERAV
jgi:GNAT superfamily N-acetyltransferase